MHTAGPCVKDPSLVIFSISEVRDVTELPQVHSHIEALMLAEEAPVKIAEGQVIFEEGELGGAMYIVRTGSVILKTSGRLLETIEAGDIVGEMALIDDSPRCATAIAGPECSLVVIKRDEFDEFVRRVPGFARELLRLIAMRLRRSNTAGT
jgi:CRP/FNR family cyclic AMP-dependent transcriptional regulator